MARSFSVGGACGTFEDQFAGEIAEALDHAFGGEGEWEEGPSLRYDDETGPGWPELSRRAVAALGAEALPHLTAFDDEGPTGVYLPANIPITTLPLSAGRALRCASLPGLRNELFELAHHWKLPLDDIGLEELLRAANAPEIATFARLALASNEAMRRDCPLWVIAEEAAEPEPAGVS